MERSELPAFLRARMAELDITSLRQLAARAEISPNTARLLLEGAQRPRERTLVKLAAALRVPLTRLRELAGRSSGEPLPFRLPPEADQLSAAQREVVLDLVRVLLDGSQMGAGGRTGWAARVRSDG